MLQFLSTFNDLYMYTKLQFCELLIKASIRIHRNKLNK